MKKILIITAICFSYLTAIGQDNCKVLLEQISGIYEGKCKNGLAQGKGKAQGIDTYDGQFDKGLPDGKGTYTWANGDHYIGQWENGMRHGEGKSSYKSHGKDTVLSGLWENDIYKGPKPNAPAVYRQVSVERYNFTRTIGIRDRVLINLYQNGMRNLGVENFMLASSSGTPTSVGESVGYDNIIFPVKIKVNYVSLNKLRTAKMDVVFEFEISEPGDWVVDIHN